MLQEEQTKLEELQEQQEEYKDALLNSLQDMHTEAMQSSLMTDPQKQFLFSQSIVDRYKKVSEVINSNGNGNVRKIKSIRSLIEESFFHGASWVGTTNFIA